jgi:hypothetical protein
VIKGRAINTTKQKDNVNGMKVSFKKPDIVPVQ